MSEHQALFVANWGPTTLFKNGMVAPEPGSLAKLGRRGGAIEPTPLAAREDSPDDRPGVRLIDRRVVVSAPASSLRNSSRPAPWQSGSVAP